MEPLNVSHPRWNLDQMHDDWRKGKIQGHTIFVYSAFLDERNASYPFIRVLSASPQNYALDLPHIVCDIFQEDGQLLATLPINIQFRHCCEKKPYFFLSYECDLSRTSKSIRLAAEWVSLKSINPPDQTNTSTPNLKIHTLPRLNSKDIAGTFVVCVRPFFRNWNSTFQLIEFLEMYKILGVSHFVFYDYQIGKGAKIVLNHYEAQGLVTVLQWTLKLSTQHILAIGQIVSINDCKMRAINRFEFLIHVDVDEFLLPRNDLMSLMI
ncbi:hypothetical protein TCAL_12398 [Tigriopus californicus]|uniref:Glycosyltransferase family 92 protein n=2 Tax=Tigriopus californicus TaxID=6832 RepID=A0A553PRH9_TIGCA|nr:hypothetical protein TCAL_12398 [Tigriopus californicus]|eukprot:TCALIF_12398-PA protein Name:"Protein of unknown function" AED:0.14 eAED:0.20 QI:0/-1/0/1/-1/1/1/0/265